MRVTNGAKIFEIDQVGCVNVKLHDHRSTKDVFWSPRWDAPASHGGHGGCNSYVVVNHDRDGVMIASINGAGEIRWYLTAANILYAFQCELLYPDVQPWAGDWVENLKVARHFGVVIEEEK